MSGDIQGGIKGAMYMAGLKAAQQTDQLILSVVSAGLESMKQVAAQAASPTGPGVGGKVDTSA